MSQVRTVLGVFLLLLALTGLGQGGWLDYLHQSADDISASDDSSPANDDAANFSVTGLEIPFLQKRMIIQAPVFFQVKELAVVAGENFHSAPPSPAPGFIASYQSVFVLRPGLLPGAPSLA